MKLSLIKIGNSQGIRIPAAIIKQCGFDDELDVVVKNKSMIVTASSGVRSGWQEISETENQANPFDEKGEWEW